MKGFIETLLLLSAGEGIHFCLGKQIPHHKFFGRYFKCNWRFFFLLKSAIVDSPSIPIMRERERVREILFYIFVLYHTVYLKTLDKNVDFVPLKILPHQVLYINSRCSNVFIVKVNIFESVIR